MPRLIQEIEDGRILFFVTVSMTHLFLNTLFNINSAIEVHSSETRQPFNQQLVSRSIVTAGHQHSLQLSAAQSQSMSAYSKQASTYHLMFIQHFINIILFVITLRGCSSKPCWQLFVFKGGNVLLYVILLVHSILTVLFFQPASVTL